MIVRKYGIELHRLTAEDIELVRVKRNSDPIRHNMFYQQIISEEQQREWFKSISNIHNYYMLIVYKGEKIGLIHGKNVNYNERTAEGGIFIWNEQHWNSFVPVLASIAMIDLTFNILQLYKTFAEVQSSNARSKHYNSELGYKPVSENRNTGKEIYMLTREDHYASAARIRKAVQDISKDHTPLTWDDIDYSTATAEDVKLLYEPLPESLRKEVFRKLAADQKL